jgi:uncharacterized protein (UPF0276 family)
MTASFERHAIGHGIGLRPAHYPEVLDGTPAVDWLEVITENFMVEGGNARRVLRAVRERWPVVLHGVSLSLGSVDPLDEDYLARLVRLTREIQPAYVSDHLCWNRLGGHTAHDLWPLPFTEEALAHVAGRVAYVQDLLGRRILVENVSRYVAFRHDEMSEWEFLSALAERADCGLLLDVNNAYVSGKNLGFDPALLCDGVPAERIGQIHLAGFQDHGTHLLDSHDQPVADEVWALYRRVVRRTGPVPTLVEWDDDLPPLERLVAEASRARAAEAEEVGRAAS